MNGPKTPGASHPPGGLAEVGQAPTQAVDGAYVGLRASVVVDNADPYIGRLIGERYRILERLGEGGMGMVFRGEHTLMNKAIAIKLLHKELGAVDDAVARFQREAQSASRLSHPSIIAVTDFGRAESGELFLAMEYVAGAALADVLADEGPLKPARAIALTRLILRGLAHAHGAGVVHRDLKPANIMVCNKDGTETVKILDFGIAKMTEGEGDGGHQLTQGGMIFGTPSYMSPEQATGETVDLRCDIYSCGIILYEMLAGRKPFVADDMVKVMALQVTAMPPPFATVAPQCQISPALEAVVTKALQKDRELRFQNAVDFLDALDNALKSTALVRMRPYLERVVDATTARLAVLKTDPRKRRMAWGAVGILMVLIIVPRLFSTSEIKPQPVEKSLVEPLTRAESLITSGKVMEAKAILMQQLSSHPKSGRVRFLLGSIAFLENDPAEGLQQYKAAIDKDEGFRGDAALLLNVRALLDDPKFDEKALRFLIDEVGEPASHILAGIANKSHQSAFRQKARKACEALSCEELDLVASHSLDLQQAKRCTQKKEAVHGLGQSGDPRAYPVLRKAGRAFARSKLHKFFGVGGNDCLRAPVKEAIEALQAAGVHEEEASEDADE